MSSTRESRAEAEEILSRHMAKKGLKSTRQRTLIVGTFLDSEGHISVDDLLSKVRLVDSRVSAATVYRTMKLLTECGLAHAQQFGDGQTRYETTAGRDHHDHLICTRCATIIEFEDERIEAMQEAVARQHGFRVTHHKMELYGVCRACQREELAGGVRTA